MANLRIIILTLSLLVMFQPQATAHPGNTASDGCHYCSTNCTEWGVPWNARHCHNNNRSLNPVEIERNAQQRAINNLFGDSETRKEKAVSRAMSESFASVQKRAGEDEIDYQLRLYTDMRSRIAPIDPYKALEIDEKLLDLERLRVQQQ